MPIFEFLCPDCGTVSEKLVLSSNDQPSCPQCGSSELRKLMSPSSGASGVKGSGRVPGAGDTACCGSSPTSRGCVPGSCCGKAGI